MLRKTALIIGLLICSIGQVQGSESAKQIVDLLQYEKQFDDYLEGCLQFSKAIPAEQLLVDNPNYFYGFNPESEEWPEVLSIYKEYYDTSCGYLTSSTFASVLAKQYSQNLSESEMVSMIKFYSTPTGQKIVRAHIEANKELQWVINDSAAKAARDAAKKYQRRLMDLVHRSEVDKPWWVFW